MIYVKDNLRKKMLPFYLVEFSEMQVVIASDMPSVPSKGLDGYFTTERVALVVDFNTQVCNKSLNFLYPQERFSLNKCPKCCKSLDNRS